jgi:hypothetical protein
LVVTTRRAARALAGGGEPLEVREHGDVLGCERAVEHVGIECGQHRLDLSDRSTNLRQHASSDAQLMANPRGLEPHDERGEASKYDPS